MTAEVQAPEQRSFEAEVGKLLHIVANSLYSEREIFLRELISNASDACDRLRYAALTAPELTAGDAALKVTVTLDAKAKTITVADNGIGMGHDELITELGTIARSGTSAFVEQLSGEEAKDAGLIGQFGVGFYSAFMVADEVVVTSRKAGEDQGWPNMWPTWWKNSAYCSSVMSFLGRVQSAEAEFTVSAAPPSAASRMGSAMWSE